jgi:hypothetical protein
MKKNDALIPQHISRRAFYSAPFILIDSIVGFSLGPHYYRLSCLMFCVFITTMIHWNKVMTWGESTVKRVDIVLASTSVLSLHLIEKHHFISPYREIWNVTFWLVFVLFLMNETLFYFQIYRYKEEDFDFKKKKQQIRLKQNIRYFCLAVSEPNTEYREYCYYRNVYTHMVVIHILPTTVSAYCAIMSASS